MVKPHLTTAERALQSQTREALFRQQIAAERAKSDAKTTKLRALRLAKEAADQEAAAAHGSSEKSSAKTRKKSI